ncbi:methyltransferase domain-containing protein [Streptomyces sp. UNOB3_S3]|uniref:methyltransferase domain-containing protein n=1 Tax=Streptomyces sp. UNOB3_S3 TaxID=2871682 RepID=UPI001E5F4A05|nr:methyltransferase domain-containing protein [Streptomyces sp. UNOB3_S3]MCC3775005.1 methyltransferase domain-containing protein [Streptomyces sp. UNOB3_S3]
MDKGSVRSSAVGELYDHLSAAFGEIMGGSLHFGYWEDADDPGAMAVPSRRMTEKMIDKLPVGPGQRVLDIGCGNGRPALDLARRTGAEVVGISISRQQVAEAGRLAASAGLSGRVTFRLADAMDLPFASDSFDGVWMFESLLHMPDASRALAQAARVLRPSGRLALSNLVVREPLAQGEESLLENACRLFQAPSVIALSDYPALISGAGLVPEELADISGNSVRRTMEAFSSDVEKVLEKLMKDGADAAFLQTVEGLSGIATDIGRAAWIGYAIATATKPGGDVAR